MTDTILKIIQNIKSIPVNIYFSMLLISSILFFLPKAALDLLGLLEFKKNNVEIIGPVYVLIVSLFIGKLINVMSKKIVEHKNLKRLHKRLNMLTPEEKSLLQVFVFESRNTIKTTIDDGVMAGLVSKNIVVRLSNTSDRHMEFPFNLQPWAREWLDKNNHLLEIL